MRYSFYDDPQYRLKQSSRTKKNKICIMCGRILNHGLKYCSFNCQSEFHYRKYIYAWKKGKENGSRGVRTRALSRYLHRYLYEKYGDKCVLCGWSRKNPVTNKVP